MPFTSCSERRLLPPYVSVAEMGMLVAKREGRTAMPPGNSGFILRQDQDEVERFQWLGPHGELVEPWAASFFSILLAAFCIA
jgi:hypothetical protein